MAVDTGIYNNIRPFQMDDPIQKQAQLYQLKGAQRKFEMDDAISAAGAEAGGDPEKMAKLLLERGQYKPAIELQTQAAALGKEKRLAGNAEIDRKLKIFEAVGSDAISLDQVWRQTLQKHGGNAQAAMQEIQPTYQQIRKKWASMGTDLPEQFDPQANFAGIGMAKEQIQYLKSLAPDVVMTDTGGSIQPMNKNPLAGPVGPLAGSSPITKTPSPATPTELARLQAERAALAAADPNDPRIKEHDRVIAGFKGGKGTDITINQPGPMSPTKAAATKIDEGILGQTEGLMRLDAIQSQFKPEYQNIITKASNLGSAWKDKLGISLTNKEKADLEDFSKYRRNAIDSMNQYIKSVTGAAMSEPEAQRILKGMPNPGQGLTDGDSPTEFKAKLDDAIIQTKRAIARSAYLKRNGMSLEDGLGKGIGLDSMPQLINSRGKEIEEQLKKTGVTGKPLERAVRRQLGVEFGLVSD